MKDLLIKIDSSLNEATKDIATLKTDMVSVKQDHVEMKGVTSGIRSSLDEHMRRTALNEHAIKLLDAKQDIFIKDITPLKKHAENWALAGKVLVASVTILASLAGIATFIYEVALKR